MLPSAIGCFSAEDMMKVLLDCPAGLLPSPLFVFS
jgi:hypothetical protein